jgi:hypothetical protein
MRYFESHSPSSVVVTVVLALTWLIGGLEFLIICALGTGAAALGYRLDRFGVRDDY